MIRVNAASAAARARLDNRSPRRTPLPAPETRTSPEPLTDPTDVVTDDRHFRRIWLPPTRALTPDAPLPAPVIGTDPIDAGTVGRIVKSRVQAAGFDPAVLGGHSLKRGAMTTGMDRGVHPTRLKQLGRHKTDAVLDTDLESASPSRGTAQRRPVTAVPQERPHDPSSLTKVSPAAARRRNDR